MGEAIAVFIIILGVVFIAGVASGIVALVLAKKKQKPVISIILAVVCFFGVVIPVHYTLAFSGLITIAVGVYSICIITKSVKFIKQMP